MNASQKEEEGHQLMAEAEKKVAARSGFFRSLFASAPASKEEGAETYVRAATAFKLAKAWLLAGQALEKAAEVYASIPDMQYDAASKYADAGKAYKNVDARKAMPALQSSINMHADAARFQQCARLQKEVAELLEGERDDSAALEAYRKAADYYDMDDAKSNANSMRVKVAALTALAGDYGDAAQLYEDIAQAALASSMLKYGAREHLLRAGLCRLCMGDIVGVQRALEKYLEMDSTFGTSREGRLLDSIVKAVEEGNVDAFTNHVYDFDNVSKLDEWKTTVLLKIKNNMKAEDDDLT